MIKPRLLARRGRSEAIKRGRVWYTTLRAVAALTLARAALRWPRGNSGRTVRR